MVISGANSSALLLLRQTSSANLDRKAPQAGAASTNEATPADKIANILANAPGVSLPDQVRLLQKVGEVLGVDMNKYASPTAYASALKQAISNLKAAAMASGQSWTLVVKGLEHQMGLDKLGISLDTVINALDGDGGSQDALNKALEKHARNAAFASSEASSEDGAYSPASALQ